MSHTPGPWELRDVPGAGLQIWANVSLGLDEHGENLQPIYRISTEPQLQVGKDGRAYVLISYEDWRQFPSVDFQVMQKANARLIAAAPDLLEACKAAKHYLEPDLVEPGRTVFWNLVHAIAKAESEVNDART